MNHEELKQIMETGKLTPFWVKISSKIKERVALLQTRLDETLGDEKGDVEVARRLHYKKSIYQLLLDLPDLIVAWDEPGSQSPPKDDTYE